ncbi:MAG: kelch repeat-containing protein [Planctomycetales bacterium]
MTQHAKFLAFLVAVAAGSASAADSPPSSSGEVLPRLSADPEVAKVLRELPAGHAAILPKVRVTGDLNDVARKYQLDERGPGGRNYCIEMVWMPDRRRAIYCGANHGGPHRLNDVWEYDLAANTWVCLFAPDELNGGKDDASRGAAWKTVELREGILRTARGGPAIIGHQWAQSTYDPRTGTMYFNSEWPFGYIPEPIRTAYLDTGKHKHEPPLWSFRPATREWMPILPARPAPRSGRALNKYLQFIPELGGCLYVDAAQSVGAWLFDPGATRWKELLPGEERAKNAGTNPALPLRVGVKAYCPDLKTLVFCTSSATENRTVHYLVETNEWKQTATGPETPAAHISFTPCGYAPRAGAVLLYDQRVGRLWSYDVRRTAWSKLAPQGPPPPKEGGKVIGYFDPTHNVFVLSQSEKVWVYRPEDSTRSGRGSK